MYAIKETKAGQQGHILNKWDAREQKTDVEKELARFLSEQRVGDDSQNDFKVEYGIYHEPDITEVLPYLMDLLTPMKGYSMDELENIGNFIANYKPEEDAHWYTWPDRIESYSYDTMNWAVVEVDEDGNEIN